VGLILSVAVRDSHALAAPVFYALPLPVTGGFLALAAWMAHGKWRRRILACLAVGVLGFWFVRSYGWAWPAQAQWKAITWNLGRPKHPFQPLVALVRAEQPDVMTLVESDGLGPAEAQGYERLLPGYRVIPGPAGLTCIVRGEIFDGSTIPLGDGGGMVNFRLRIRGERVDVFAVDIDAEPRIPRRRQLESLAKFTQGRTHTLVMGDFNTPVESVWLAGLRVGYQSALEGRHRGFRETWFYDLPLLSLDQIWMSRDFQPVFASRRLTLASDHAPVVATFDVR